MAYGMDDVTLFRIRGGSVDHARLSPPGDQGLAHPVDNRYSLLTFLTLCVGIVLVYLW